MLKNLLLYRLGIFNVLMAGVVAWAASKGWVTTIFASDISGISYVILGLFLLTGVSTAIQAKKIAEDKNAIKEGQATTKEGRKRLHKLKHLQNAAGHMSLLGIIGTIIGFIVAFGGVDVSTLLSASGVGQNVTTMMQGMGVALYTTLMGAVCGGWTQINYDILKTAADILVEDETEDEDDFSRIS